MLTISVNQKKEKTCLWLFDRGTSLIIVGKNTNTSLSGFQTSDKRLGTRAAAAVVVVEGEVFKRTLQTGARQCIGVVLKTNAYQRPLQ